MLHRYLGCSSMVSALEAETRRQRWREVVNYQRPSVVEQIPQH